MAMELTWSVEGQTQLMRRLRGIQESMGDWTPAFTQASNELKKIFSDEVFSTRGGAIQESWKPLNPKYLAQKREMGYPSDILIRTGAMKKAFQSLVRGDSAKIWNDIDYFKYHQSKDGRTSKLPRRVMMKLGDQQKELVVKIFHTHFKNKLE